MEINKIYNMDCLEGLKRIDDKSIDLTITSPPYDNLRTYNGFSFDFEGIAKELYRITKQGGVLVWVVNDQTVNGSETGTSFKQSLYFKEIGFNLHDTMIWDKRSQACHDYRNHRYKQEFEYMFILSKGKPITYNEIKDRIVKNAGKVIKKSSKRNSDGSIRKYPEIKLGDFQARSNIWYFEPERRSKHPAPYPIQLVKDHVFTWSNENETILDPFIGSGTTAIACINTNRNYIGFELDTGYFNLANERIGEHKAERVKQ